MNDQLWYLQRGTQQFGPYRWEDVVELARTGRVEPTDLLFRPGDAASQQAGAIPGLLPHAAARPRWLVPSLLAAAAALLVALIVVVTGGDDESADTDRTTRPPRTTATTLPGDTTSSAATTTTAPSSTTTAATTTTATTTSTSTTTTTTIAPSTTLALPTTDDLVAAIPLAADVPADWFVDDPIVTEPSPQTGPYYGICGGDNAATRAIRHDMVAYVEGPEYLPPQGAFYLAIYAFPTAEDASAFLQEGLAQIDCPAGIAYDRTEGDGPDQMDWFTEGYGDNEVVWSNFDQYATILDVPSDSDEWFAYSWSSDHATSFEGADYSLREDEVDLVERYGRIVITTSRYGTCCWSGFGNADEIPAYTPDVLQLLAARDLVMPYVLGVLTERDVI